MSELVEYAGPEVEVGVRVAYKVNTGHYENMDVEATIKTTVRGGKKVVVDKYNQLYETAVTELTKRVQEIREEFPLAQKE